MEVYREKCKNHPKKAARGRCASCWAFLCADCLTKVEGYQYCSDCSDDPHKQNDSRQSKPKRKPKVSQWLLLLLIVALAALLLDIFYLQWGFLGGYVRTYQVLKKPISFGPRLKDYDKTTSDHFIIYSYDKELANTVIEQAETYFTQIVADLLINEEDIMHRGKFMIILTADDSAYKIFTGESISGAVTDYETKSIVMNMARISPVLSITLPHEITHAILFEVLNSANRVPDWLDEGLALYEEAKFDNSLVETRWNDYRPDLTGGSHISISGLEIPEDPFGEQSQLFYAESASLVQFLVDEYGMYKIMNLMKEIQNGSSVDASLNKIYGEDIPNQSVLQEKWLIYIRS